MYPAGVKNACDVHGLSQFLLRSQSKTEQLIITTFMGNIFVLFAHPVDDFLWTFRENPVWTFSKRLIQTSRRRLTLLQMYGAV